MFSNSPAKALGIVGTDAVNPKDSRGNIKEVVIVPRAGRNAPAVPEMHCFEFRALLQAERRLLLGEVSGKIAVSGESPAFAQQSALTTAAVAIDLGKVIRENRELRDIVFALARIRDGSYGICFECGGEISRARLKTDPTAKRCLPCQIRVLPITID
jgi:DnaK suppressor protein